MQNVLRSHTFGLVAFTLMACSGQRDTPATASSTSTGTTQEQVQFGGPGSADSLFFRLERTPCYGPCKAFRINVYRSGFATYEGILNVEKEGRHVDRLDQEVIRELYDKARESGFFDLKERYDADVTDLPSTFVRIAANGIDKTVMGRVGAPASFKALVEYAEGLLIPRPWKPAPLEP